MDAMDYEFLIRRVYDCGRHGIKGADADVYRKMEKAEAHLNSPYWNKTQEEKEHDYHSAFIEVKNHVASAIRKGTNKIEHSMSSDEDGQLKKMLSDLRKMDFYDKDRLNQIIDDADEIFRKHGLEPR